jgi:hypothetical protein
MDLVDLQTQDIDQSARFGFSTGNALGDNFTTTAGNAPMIYLRQTVDPGMDIAARYIAEGNWGTQTTGLGVPTTYTIVLETTGAWSAEFYAGATSLGTYTYTTNPTVAYVGFGCSAYHNDMVVDNFTLSEVPEPGTMALLATGLIGLLAYAWRKRR